MASAIEVIPDELTLIAVPAVYQFLRIDELFPLTTWKVNANQPPRRQNRQEEESERMEQDVANYFLIAALLIAATLIVTLVVYPDLSSRIPIHRNLRGEVDRYGDKLEVFL
jgi:hypothetical protein